MGLIASIREARAAKEGPYSISSDPPKWLGYGNEVYSGVVVDESTAMTSSAVGACNKNIAEDIASLPYPIYERLSPRGKRLAREHHLYRILHDQPNPEMTSMVFREARLHHVLLTGKSVAYIEFARSTEVKALWLLRPDRTRIVREDGVVRYYVRSEQTGKEEPFESWEILHVPGLGWDGVNGYSPVQMALRNAIGLALALDQYGGSFFGNMGQPGGYFKHPGTLGEESWKRLNERLIENRKGPRNANKTAILEEGMDWQSVVPPNDAAQFLESRKFQIADVARWYRMPLHKLQEMDKATFSNIEQQAIEYYTDTLRPWIVRTEQEDNRKLFLARGETDFFCEHKVEGFLRGDAKSEAEALHIMRQDGIINADEWREIKNMNPQPDGQGETYLVPLNMVPADQIGETDDGEDNQDRFAARLHRNFLRLFEDAEDRIIRRECKALRRGALRLEDSSAEDLDKWVTQFYEGHEAYVSRALRAPLSVISEQIREFTGEGDDPDGSLLTAPALCMFEADKHSRRSRGALAVAFSDGPEALYELLDEWEESRAKEAADEVCKRVIRKLLESRSGGDRYEA